MSVTGFIYDDDIINGINNMSFSTNVLEKYDNVTYHCALFAFNANDQKAIDEELIKTNRIPKNVFEENNRIYIAKDGVTTKFSIKSFSMKNTFGNIESPMNIATYEIKIKLVETLSCILTNELEALAYYTGYDEYMNRPYWFEIWFSGFKHDTLEPVDRIPLDNKNITSLLYKGCFGQIKSQLDSSGTIWDIPFIPVSISLLNKNTNLLSVPVLTKEDNDLTLEQFMKNCANNMFKRFLMQIAKTKEQVNDIKKIYKNNNFITIKYEDKTKGSIISINADNKTVGEQVSSIKPTEEELKGQEEAKKQTDISKQTNKTSDNNYSDTNNGSADTTANASSKNLINDKTDYFTTVCQKFLFKTIDYNDCVAKYDIKSQRLDTYNNMPLYYHVVTITFLKDPYISKKLSEIMDSKNKDFDKVSYFKKCRSDGSLVKKYQFGYSGADTSVLEVFNKYDMLYFMNALPQTSQENILNNIAYKKENINDLKSERDRMVTLLKNAIGLKNLNRIMAENKLNDINSNNTNDYLKQINFFSNYIKDNKEYFSELLKEMNENKLGSMRYNGNLEDLYKNVLYNKVKNGDLYNIIASINKIPELNNDLTNNINPSSSSSDYEKEKISIAAQILNDRIYRSGQLTETKFTILGDPYWIATHSYMLKEENRTEDDAYKESLIMDTTPNYRCVFTIKSIPDQNDYYKVDNPTDYNFEYSLHASGIYSIVECESNFEDGKFIQKIRGVLDIRFVKDIK